MLNYTIEQLQKLSGIFTATEIHQQPATWLKTITQIRAEAEAIKAFISKITTNEDFDIILTGAGTSEFVGNALYSYVTTNWDYKVKSYGTTDIVASPLQYLSPSKPTLLISFGRSGNSPESVGAVEVANTVCSNIQHLFITCNDQGALSKMAAKVDNAYAINLTPETHDQSFAMTSSYTNMMLAALLCLELDHFENTVETFETIIPKTEVLLNERFSEIEDMVKAYDFKRIVYLGANSLKGIAQEASLKMLELTAGDVVTMYDTPLGFRHGPKSIINDDTLTVVFCSDDAYTFQFELDLIKEMSGQRKGNKIMAVTSIEREEVANLVDYYYCFGNEQKVHNMYLGFSYIALAQVIALYKSIALEITPDNPCPSGEVNRVVQGVTLYPFIKDEGVK